MSFLKLNRQPGSQSGDGFLAAIDKYVALLPDAICTFVLSFIVLALAACGGGGDSSKNPSPTDVSDVVVKGTLTPPIGESAATYIVTNTSQSAIPTAQGDFSTTIGENSFTYTFAVSSDGNKIYSSTGNFGNTSVAINAQSTAEVLVLLNPLLIQGTASERDRLMALVKTDSAVKSLASVVDKLIRTSYFPQKLYLYLVP